MRCRCGIKVYLKDGRVRYIEGNRDHPINKGVLCGKGSAGIMQHYSPARLSKPLLRVGERGSGEFKEIEWDEAMDLAVEWLGKIRETDPRKFALFTGRDQSQAMTGWWASQFGTPNFAAHGGFCSVNMATAGCFTIGGSFWEFGEPDWEHTRYFMMFGVAEDHDSNPLKTGIGRLKTKAQAKFVSVNPIKTGYSAVADEWVGIRPGTDGLFAFALIHELLKAEKIDWQFLVRYTNSPWLVIQDPAAADDGLFARDNDGNPLCYDAAKKTLADATGTDISPALVGEYKLPDGRTAVPAFQLLAARYMDDRYAPESVAEECGVPADKIKRLAAELAHAAFEQEVVLDVEWTDWAGRKHDKMIGPPGLDACDARYLGALERFPHLQGHTSAADPAGIDRCTRRIPLQGAFPEARPVIPETGGPRCRAQYTDSGSAARHADRTRRPAGGFRRIPDTYRQGVQLGQSDFGPRPDAYGDPQRLEGRSRTRSTRCSCTCRT